LASIADEKAVSSISVYADLSPNTTESAGVHATADLDHAKLSIGNYGALKAACEARRLDT
jgi:hypothetical protein